MGKKQAEAEKVEARAWFREHCPPGSTIFCVLDHVSQSGMLRRIRVLVPYQNGNGIDFLHPNYSAGVLTGYKQAPRDAHKGDGLQIGGCGMDMGFALVSSLAHAVYPEGFGCIGKGCPSNDHSNGDRDYRPHGTPTATACTQCGANFANAQTTCPACVVPAKVTGEHGHWHKSGAYAYRHRWL